MEIYWYQSGERGFQGNKKYSVGCSINVQHVRGDVTVAKPKTESETRGRRAAIKEILAAGAVVAGGAPVVAVAKSGNKVGNYPAGIRSDSVFVGLTLPLTGPFSAEGNDQLLGCRLAIEQINSGSDEIKKISPKTKRGVLGKTIAHKVIDIESKPNAAIQAVSTLISRNKAMMIYGSVSSAVAIALEKYCDREKTPYLVGISGSNDTTGKDCQRYGIRVWTTAYSVIKGVIPGLAKKLGGGRKVVYSVPDYSWGHSVYETVQPFVKEAGWTNVGKQVHPLGISDYSTYLINIANSGADTFIVLDYGADAAAIIKQAKQFGVLDKMNLIVPWMASFLGEEVGPELIGGVYGGICFWWTLQDRYPVARDFVTSFQKKYGKIPHDPAFIGYLNMALWADAVERAGTFFPPDVIKSYEAEVVRPSPVGDVYVRAADHQGIINFPIVRGKTKQEKKNKDDVFEVISMVNGANVAAPPTYFGCRLGPYE